MNPIRIMIVDDHPMLRLGLITKINEQPDMLVVGEADNGADAFEQIPRLKPDVIIMDISMPRSDGVRTTTRITDAYPDIRILGFTVHRNESELRQMLQAGAAGYVLKTSNQEETMCAIRAVAAGQQYIDPSLTNAMVRKYITRPPNAGNTPSGISPRELEVMRLIAWGYTNKEIADRLAISVKTVETYKIKLKIKLGLYTRAEIVEYAKRHGLMEERP